MSDMKNEKHILVAGIQKSGTAFAGIMSPILAQNTS